MDAIDCVVIGAGAVGLACAAALARRGLWVVVLERGRGVGEGLSSRNSEVIHAGLYYPTGSLKHRLCVEGRRRLYPYLAARGVAHRKCGKLIVAAEPAEVEGVAALKARGEANDVEGLSWLSAAEAMALEPQLHCAGALLSAETGVFDSHGYMLALQGEIEDHGGSIAFETRLERAALRPGGGLAFTIDGQALEARMAVNAAGLHAQAVAAAIEGLDPAHVPPLRLAKGSYFGCAGRPAFSRLIYPAPVDGGLGVHVTLDLAGRMRFGPDVEWLDHGDPDAIDYGVDLARADRFYAAIRRYWPSLPDGALTPDYAGCRPKLTGPGAPAGDFRIDGPQAHGHPGLVNLFGVESPGLTASLAIGEAVASSLIEAQ